MKKLDPIPTSRAPAPEKAPAPRQRPSDFSQGDADAICDWIASGKSLRSYCAQPWAPRERTVFRWLRERSDFHKHYRRARELQVHTLFDEILEIADDDSADKVGGAVARARIRIEALKRVAGKLKPKVYGD